MRKLNVRHIGNGPTNPEQQGRLLLLDLVLRGLSTDVPVERDSVDDVHDKQEADAEQRVAEQLRQLGVL